MGFFSALFGGKAAKPNDPMYMEAVTYARRYLPSPKVMPSNAHPYLDAGAALVLRFEKSLKLPDWASGVATYSPEERKAIEADFEEFQRHASDTAAQKGGDKMVFQRKYLDEMQGVFSGEVLFSLGGNYRSWTSKDEIPENWRCNASSLLKSWAWNHSPYSLDSLGWLLAKVTLRSEAMEVFKVLLLYPSYANAVNLHGGDDKYDIGASVVKDAEEALKELQ